MDKMDKYCVTIGVYPTFVPVKTFVVLAEDIIGAQIRVMSRIQGITKSTMYNILSASTLKS